MERGEDPVSNVLEPDFGGGGARQAIGAAMKDIEHYTQIFVVALDENQNTVFYHSEMTHAELALITARMSGYSALIINDWSEE